MVILGLPLVTAKADSSSSSHPLQVPRDVQTDNRTNTGNSEACASQASSVCAESVPQTEPNTTCSAACHVCGDPDPLHGCSSCERTCHADCRSELCALEPCGECPSCDIVTHLKSDLCKEAQRDHLGCHECHRMDCFASALDCHARCRKFAHFCRAPQGTDASCSSCGKTCHLDSSDPRCDFFGQDRGNLPFHDGIDAAQQSKGEGGHSKQNSRSHPNA